MTSAKYTTIRFGRGQTVVTPDEVELFRRLEEVARQVQQIAYAAAHRPENHAQRGGDGRYIPNVRLARLAGEARVAAASAAACLLSNE